jgi:hypothetical protein
MLFSIPVANMKAGMVVMKEGGRAARASIRRAAFSRHGARAGTKGQDNRARSAVAALAFSPTRATGDWPMADTPRADYRPGMGYILVIVLGGLVVLALLAAAIGGRKRAKGRAWGGGDVTVKQPAANEPTPAASSTASTAQENAAQRRVPPA